MGPSMGLDEYVAEWVGWSVYPDVDVSSGLKEGRLSENSEMKK